MGKKKMPGKMGMLITYYGKSAVKTQPQLVMIYIQIYSVQGLGDINGSRCKLNLTTCKLLNICPLQLHNCVKCSNLTPSVL
jgi:hypothetical protein